MTARVVCCGAFMGEKAGFDKPGIITHGLCPACMRAAYRELAQMTLSGKARLVTPRSRA